jgi:hypothetical protein
MNRRDYRQAILVSALILSLCVQNGFSQQYDTTSVTLKGGYRRLYKVILTGDTDTDSIGRAINRKHRHYLAEVQIAADGRLGEDIKVYGLEDSSFTFDVIRTIKSSQGFWTNHVGHNITALLEMDYLFWNEYENMDSLLAKPSNKAYKAFKENAKQPSVFLQPIITEIGITMH